MVEFRGDRVCVDRGYDKVNIISILTLLITSGNRVAFRSAYNKGSRSYSRNLENASIDLC